MPRNRDRAAWLDRRARALVLLLLLSAGLVGLIGCSGDEPGGTPEPVAERDAEPDENAFPRQAGDRFDAAAIFERSADGVVTVRAVFGEPTGGPLRGGGSEGSGFVLSEDGEIITNAHVVSQRAGDSWVPGDEVYVEFADHNVAEAEVVGADPFYDVALLRVDPNEFDLTALEAGDVTSLEPGQSVAAIGSPFGAQQSLSVGVISATDRSIRSLTEFLIEGAIQTDASINPGNSGGPLLDARGRVIGISQQIESRTGRHEGVGYAVPISAVLRSADQLRRHGEVAYPYIGVSSQGLYPQLAEALGYEVEQGAVIAEVVPGGPADEAGIRGGDRELQFQAGTYSVGGDVVLAIDGEPVLSPDDLARLIVDEGPGDTVTLEILRNDERQSVQLTLGERPLGNIE